MLPHPRLGWFILGIVLALWNSRCLGQGGGWQDEARRFGWKLDLASAKSAGRRSGKPLMVVVRCVP